MRVCVSAVYVRGRGGGGGIWGLANLGLCEDLREQTSQEQQGLCVVTMRQCMAVNRQYHPGRNERSVSETNQRREGMIKGDYLSSQFRL